MKVAMTMAKANFQFDHEYSSLAKRDESQKTLFFAQREQQSRRDQQPTMYQSNNPY